MKAQLALPAASGMGVNGVVAVMHDLNLTAMFADRIAMLHAGPAATAPSGGARPPTRCRRAPMAAI